MTSEHRTAAWPSSAPPPPPSSPPPSWPPVLTPSHTLSKTPSPPTLLSALSQWACCKIAVRCLVAAAGWGCRRRRRLRRRRKCPACVSPTPFALPARRFFTHRTDEPSSATWSTTFHARKRRTPANRRITRPPVRFLAPPLPYTTLVHRLLMSIYSLLKTVNPVNCTSACKHMFEKKLCSEKVQHWFLLPIMGLMHEICL